MNTKLVVSLLAFLALFAGSARAQEESPKVDVFVGYSYLRFNPNTSGVDSFGMNGGSASIAYNVNHWLSGVADFGAYHNGGILHTGLDGTLSSYLFGPRVSYHHYGRYTPFAQVLFGVAHAGASVSGASGSDNAFAMSVGGGLDVGFKRHLTLRPFQFDYLLTRFGEGTGSARSQNNLRVSTGVVFRF